jgi:fumarate reductase flavoprotein subunit
VTPHGANVGRRIDGDRGTYRMVRVLHRNLAARGAQVHHASRVTALAPSAAGWRLTVDGPLPARHIEARHVVLCDGGFQASRELVTRYIGPQASDIVLRAAVTGTGDALRMGLAAGAATAGLGRFYGHILSRDALHREDLWPYPVLDGVCEQGLIIDRWGRPLAAGFADGIQLANILARTEDPRGWSVVVTAGGEGHGGGPAPGAGTSALDHLERLGGTVCRAGDARRLAADLGLPAGRLADAIEQRLGRSAAAGALVGVPIVPGITVTMGGLAVRPDGAVRADDGSALAGLFACGSACGGIQGGPRGGYLGGLAVAAVTAWITAATIGRRAAR